MTENRSEHCSLLENGASPWPQSLARERAISAPEQFPSCIPPALNRHIAPVAGIHVFRFGKQDVDGRHESAFTRVFDALCPAMTNERSAQVETAPDF